MSGQQPSIPPQGPCVPEGLEHLWPMFLAEMEKDRRKLEELAAGADDAALAEHAHAMRGKCGMFGERLLYDLLAEIERHTEAGQREGFSPLIVRVAERVADLKVYGAAEA